MKLPRISLVLLSEFAVLFSFLCGFYLRLRLDSTFITPNYLVFVINSVPFPIDHIVLMNLLPIIFFLTFLGSYSIGRWLGLAEALLGFAGGLYIDNYLGVVVVVFAFIFGIFSPLRED
jgi:hypothetical protein